MSSSLASLKRCQPRRRFRDVLRPRLIRALDDGLEGDRGPVVLRAPDGWGKTTALAAWAARLERRVAWWRFCPVDDDPACVVHAIAESLHELRPGCCVAARDGLQLDGDPPIAALVDQIGGHIAAGETPGVLILDDIHVLRSEAARELLARICAGPATGLQFVLSGSLDGPEPDVAASAVLDESILRFDEEETREFVRQTADLDLDAAAIQTLDEYAGGRIASLLLATQTLTRAGDPDRSLAFLGDGPEEGALIARLLRGLPRPEREFLERTSILTHFCAPLCDAVTGHDDGGEMIGRLDQLNLFTEALDAEHVWFRIHPALARPLCEHLTREDAEAVGTLHRRAAAWFDQQERFVEAALHARASGDMEWIAVLVEHATADLMARAAWETLGRWRGEIPAETVAGQPGLRVADAWRSLRDGDLDQTEESVQQVMLDTRRDDPSPYALDLQGQGCVVQAQVSLERGDPRIAVELAERGTELLAEENLWARRRIPAILGTALRDDGDLAGAEQGFLEVERVGRYLEDTWTIVRGLCLQAELRIVQGELRGADVLYDNAAGITEQQRARRFGPAALIDVGIAELRWHRDHLADGLRHTENALQTLGDWRATDLRTRALAMRARILRSQREFAEAERALDRADEAACEAGVSSWTRALVTFERARLWLSQGELDRVEAWVTRGSARDRDSILIREMEGLVVARLFLALERHDEALALLARMEQDAAAGRRRGRVIEIRVLQALGRFGQVRHEKAMSRLGRALRRAMRERMVRLFLDEGAPMAEVLRDGVERNIWVRPEIQPFAQALLAACEGEG